MRSPNAPLCGHDFIGSPAIAALNAVLPARAAALFPKPDGTALVFKSRWQLDKLRLIRPPVLKAIGWPGLPIHSQTYFWAPGCGQGVIVPAQELVALVLKGNENLRGTLFTPRALESFAALELMPELRAKKIGVRGTLPLRPVSELMLRWMMCFPTARRCWASVYAYAMHGQLGLQLPSVEVEVRFSTLRHYGYVLAVRTILEALRPTETPLEVASSLMGARWDFAKKGLSAPAPRQELAGADGSWRLSDAEWPQIQRLLYAQRAQSIPLERTRRTAADLVIYKCLHGVEWARVPDSPVAVCKAMSLEARLRIEGKLEPALDRLAQLRVGGASSD
jgi:hypothetical protein